MSQTSPATVAYSFVMADLLHYGHIRLLKTAREKSDHHICGLISDESCHIWQGMNICNFDERKGVLESLDCVDEIVKQETMDPTENLKELHRRFPDAKIIMVHGDDWKALPASDYLQQIGGTIIQPEYYSELSRQNIIQKFRHSLGDHPLRHEFYTRHFRLGNIVQFDPQPASHLISSKANTLKSFQSLLKLSKIEKLFIFTADEFLRQAETVVDSVRTQFGTKQVVMRSSSFNEDTLNASNAGQYESVIGVDAASPEEIKAAARRIISSYEEKGAWSPKDQILVQTQTHGLARSGVVFTRNMETGAPYYLINYDDTTGRSDVVTSGDSSKSIWFLRDPALKSYPTEWRKLMAAIQEVEKYLEGMVLDIEFAERENGEIVIFQIRPLVANLSRDSVSDETVRSLVDANIARYRKATQEITGGKAFLSDMAFWNPAELIGDNPRPLDYSIFREIITKSAWNEGLVPLGYSKVDAELMHRYGNKPYIVVDHAFYSLIPASLDEAVKLKLYEFYLQKLADDLTAHDKVEFEVVSSCFSFDLGRRLEEMRSAGFPDPTLREVEKALREMTNEMIGTYRVWLERDLASLKKLGEIRERAEKRCRRTSDPFALIDGFLELVAALESQGTPQFTRVARQAFVASSLLKDLVRTEALPQGAVDGFMAGLSTVASEFEADSDKLASGEMTQDRFLQKYGHLRAGTYDITAKRYDEMEISDFAHPAGRSARERPAPASGLDEGAVRRAMEEHAFPAVSFEQFLGYLKSSLEQREYFKFEFTKSLSLGLVLFARAGEALGMSREDLSYLDLKVIRSAQFYTNPDELKECWEHFIESSRRSHLRNEKLVLPPIIEDESDFKAMRFFASRPNFITQDSVEGELVSIERTLNSDIENKIVLIEKADPGFDWIFARGIKGLITKYGGAASHMAIRCAEFNIPAAIGCGDNIYNRIRTKKRVKLDCRGKKLL
jgi:cytidyltransferase-like protein